MEKAHIFQTAGLGSPGYKYLGMSEMVHVTPGFNTVQAGGSCDYCGTAIRWAFHFQSSDGKKFKVGCDCVAKSGDSGLTKIISKDIRELERQKRLERKAKKLEKTKNEIEILFTKDTNLLLAQRAHPCRPNESLLDYVQWNIANGYFDNALRTLKNIK